MASRDANSTEQRTLEEAREWLRERLRRRAAPIDGLESARTGAVIDALSGLDPESWTEAWGGLADSFADDAQAAAGDRYGARAAWMSAYRASFIGRYPVPNHPLKLREYERARTFFLRATAYDEPPLEPILLPFHDRPDRDGRDHLSFYLTKPSPDHPWAAQVRRLPVAMVWAGIDTWKEDLHDSVGSALRGRGFAVVLVDMPGVGESPVYAGVDAERQWTPILDWIAGRDDLDASRVAAVGLSFGGYWAMKLAHTHRERIRCAVNWGGGVHISFAPEWQDRSRNADSYLMDLMEARAAVFGGRTYDDYIARCRELSLLDQGLLDQPCAPLLLTNGRDDAQNSIDDIYLSLDHGNPKAVRVFDGGHLGEGAVLPTIVDWVTRQLRPA